MSAGHRVAGTGREAAKAMFSPPVQDLQSMRNVAGLVSPPARVNNCRKFSPLWRVRGCQRREVPRASRGYQTPQVRNGGHVQQDFQGILVTTHGNDSLSPLILHVAVLP